MSEPSGWTVPGAPGAPQHAQAPAPGGWGEPSPAPGAPTWGARAPRPGIVPLRPLSLGELWDGAFQAVRTNPGPVLGSSAIIVVIITAITFVVQLLFTGELIDSMSTLGTDPSATPREVFGELGSVLPGLLGGSLLAGIVSLVAMSALTGVVTVSVSTAVLGRRTAGADLWRRVRERLGALVGVSLVAGLVPGLGVLLLLAPGFALIAGGAAAGSDATLIGGGLALLVGGLVAVALGLFLATRLLLAPAVLMLEGQPVGRSLARAWRLSRRGFWRLLGVYLLTTVCIAVAAGVVSVPFQILSTAVGAAVGAGSDLYLPVSLGITAVGSALVSTVLYPLQSAVTALQYVDQRMRQEGLDVELTRAAAQ